MLYDFLRTTMDKDKLSAALEVIKEFKSNEDPIEFWFNPLLTWEKLERLEEFLDHLVNNVPLNTRGTRSGG